MKKRTTLNEIAYEKIKEKIMRGDFIKENVTSQNQLVEELQMSRTPIVSALQRLQQDGFLKVISNQGIIIQEPSIEEINNCIDARIAIETFSIKNTINLFTENDFQNLDEIIKDQKICCDNKDYFNFAHLDADFHQYILEKEGNHLFIQFMSNIKERTFFNAASFLEKKQCMPIFIKQHERIIEALKQCDCELAIKQVEEHIRNGKVQFA